MLYKLSLLLSFYFYEVVTITISVLGFPGGSDGKESTCNMETWVWSLGREDPLEKKRPICFSILAWKILWTEEPGGLQSMGSQRVGTIEHMCMMTCWEFWFCKELKDIVMCIPWGGTSTLPQGCSLVSWLLLSCLPFSSLGSIGIYIMRTWLRRKLSWEFSQELVVCILCGLQSLLCIIKLWLAASMYYCLSEMSSLVTALIGLLLCMDRPMSDYDMNAFDSSWCWNFVDCGSKTISEMYKVKW